MNPQIQAFFDKATSTVTYVVYEAPGSACAIIDPVLDFDPKSGRTSTSSAEVVIAFIKQHGLKLEWVLETHVHADHLSAAPYLVGQLGGRTGIGVEIGAVQKAFSALFPRGPGTFDHLFAPDEVFKIGAMEARALHVPGHTPVRYCLPDRRRGIRG